MCSCSSSSRTDAIFGEHANTQKRLGIPVLVGEWGGYSEGDEWYPHIYHLLKFFDDRKWSNTYWAFHEGLIGDGVMDILNRPYPRAVTGEIKAYNHDREANKFTLSYEQTAAFDVKSIIYVPSEPKAVECDGEYEIVPCEFGGYTVEIKTETGLHEVVISL